MVAMRGRGGVTVIPAGTGWARPTEHATGNDIPPITGRVASYPFGPGPHPPSQAQGGQLGANDGVSGADPDAPKLSPQPRRIAPVVEGQASNGGTAAPGYANGAAHTAAGGWGANSWAGRLGPPQDPQQHGRQSFWRGGIQGFNDKLAVKDRHAYWDTGRQLTGTDFIAGSAPPNTYNNPLQQPPRPILRLVQRTLTHQIGSDHTANQDDLTRPYTWLGEQGSGWAPVYGGTPGLYQPYGSRGGVPYPIVDPTDGQGGQVRVWAGPPHGLHSLTFPDVGDTLARYGSTPQMRPVRIDRPSNSPQAGQSYSQTVQMQGGVATSSSGVVQTGLGIPVARGWAGAVRPG